MRCCAPRGYEQVFSERTARRDAKRYRRKGLDRTARRMVDFLRGRGIGGAGVLEIGGGVGAIQIELLKAGAGRATNLELSREYEKVAAELLREARIEGRVERRVADVVREGEMVAAADVVVMHRVVCCYPDYEALVGAAAGRARRLLVMSFPRDLWITRAGFVLFNLFSRLMRWEFRGFVHPPAAIVAVAEEHGLRLALAERGGFPWQIAALERVP